MDSTECGNGGMSETPDNPSEIVPVLRPATLHLKLFRPHTIDLILTKMMRGDDPQDMEDVDFLVRHDGITREQMESAFANVRMPDMVELHDAFAWALPLVRGILDRHSGWDSSLAACRRIWLC